jgi:crotonobetainyl-CoA:carnitine CoA-transferase CaiB-like acyl-CoA transferase
VRNIDSPLRFDDRNDDTHAPAPLLGEHTNAILEGLLNLTAEQVAALEARGIVRRAAPH